LRLKAPLIGGDGFAGAFFGLRRFQRGGRFGLAVARSSRSRTCFPALIAHRNLRPQLPNVISDDGTLVVTGRVKNTPPERLEPGVSFAAQGPRKLAGLKKPRQF
jgi:hypothetical protein